jgi:hypothetical protein
MGVAQGPVPVPRGHVPSHHLVNGRIAFIAPSLPLFTTLDSSHRRINCISLDVLQPTTLSHSFLENIRVRLDVLLSFPLLLYFSVDSTRPRSRRALITFPNCGLRFVINHNHFLFNTVYLRLTITRRVRRDDRIHDDSLYSLLILLSVVSDVPGSGLTSGPESQARPGPSQTSPNLSQSPTRFSASQINSYK